MRVALESGLGLLVAAILALTFAGSLTRRFSLPATREEAIEISKSGALMRGYMAKYPWFWAVEITYYDTSSARNAHDRVPEGHSLWRILWEFSSCPRPTQSVSSLIVFVDAESWTVALEGYGVGY